MNPTALEVAENATFQNFVNCYLREADSGAWHSGSGWADRRILGGLFHGIGVIELRLKGLRGRLALDIGYRSLIGRHRILSAWVNHDSSDQWSPLRPLDAVLLLVRELYDPGMADHRQREQELELVYRLVESCQLMARFIEARADDPSLEGERFIESEQSLLYGHWSHPTPKSRQGMSFWQQDHYAPELAGHFRLHCFAVRRAWVRQDSLLERSAETLVLEVLGDVGLSQDEVCIPVHPLQAQWLIHQPQVKQAIEAGVLRDLGAIGPEFTPTSSVRTLYSDHSPWMFKVSIPVKVTNSLRRNQVSELRAGVVAAKLLEKSGFVERNPQFSVLTDPAWLTVQLPEGGESGFEIILRHNPFIGGERRGVQSIAAILQEPLPGRPSRMRTLIEGLALREGRNVNDVALDWFGHYWHCAVDTLIRLYDEQGIALEAHQQNSLLDISGGYPSRYYYRDNQGYYLADSYREHLCELEPQARYSEELYYSEAMIRDRFGYYLFLNQLAAVIHRLGADGLADEASLLQQVRTWLSDMRRNLKGAGLRLVNQLLEQPELAYKANLLTRVQDVDELTAELELAVYTRVPNPLHDPVADSHKESADDGIDLARAEAIHGA
ncbi:IucA/IucC family protein [Marinobacterium lutimaris]|uniref:Siderophore synthetase component n=1 Tax=Marinobacterium lutimaris TaxID=568106 RepID=A0A1H5WJX6_9GAMM|nr:IucA/IucC family protein [Marinobacterium lutimaris]SEF99802.1 Siderophore synthetase component [Marinobacterium lutimaris]